MNDEDWYERTDRLLSSSRRGWIWRYHLWAVGQKVGEIARQSYRKERRHFSGYTSHGEGLAGQTEIVHYVKYYMLCGASKLHRLLRWRRIQAKARVWTEAPNTESLVTCLNDRRMRRDITRATTCTVIDAQATRKRRHRNTRQRRRKHKYLLRIRGRTPWGRSNILRWN